MKGTVFRLLAEDTHPWIIISEERDGFVFAVSVTDASKHPNSSCMLKAGEHEGISKNSAVYYRKCRELDVREVKRNLHRYATIYPNLCSKPMLQRIIAGAFASEDMTARLLIYLR